MHTRSVVVTGMGVVTPFGVGIEPFWKAISTNVCAIKTIDRFTTPGGMTSLGATIPADCLAEAEQDYHGNLCTWAMDKALQSLFLNAHISADTLRKSGRGAIFFSNHFDGDIYDQTMRDGGQLTPLTINDWCLDRWAEWLQERTGAEDGMGIITTCTGANTAIGLGMDWIRLGLCDWVIAGGMEMIHPELLAEQDCLRSLSSTGCRPFAKDRDGTVMGDGVGLLLLEDATIAQQRQAKIWATLAGYSVTSDNSDLTRIAADGHSIYQTMMLALQDANLTKNDIGYINAAATGSPALDGAELKAVVQLFPDTPPPISSLKSQIGHSIGGSGALETIATVLALDHQYLPPTLGTDPAVATPIDIVPQARPHSFSAALNNAVSMSGHMCTLVLKRGLE